MLIGLLSGSGTEAWPGLCERREATVTTPYGPVEHTVGRIGEVDVVHLSRHGHKHRRLSNHVEHRTNLSALIAAKVDAVIGFTVCGALDPSVPLGAVVIFDDLYFPSNRLPDGTLCTFHDRPGEAARGHWIFERPFSEPLRQALIGAEHQVTVPVVPKGCYGHVDGPRFNSRAEVRVLAGAGVTALSQTAGPEAVLAGEAGVPYALAGLVTDYANGVTEASEPVDALLERVANSSSTFASLVAAAVPTLAAAELGPVGVVHRVEP
ncbi:MAG: MTAP family purine nucleoside phosphorylase [Steroidobacteraceae bacterium]